MTGEVWYVIICRECNDIEDPVVVVMPFESPEERGKWAADHRRSTGHNRWYVVDQPERLDNRPPI